MAKAEGVLKTLEADPYKAKDLAENDQDYQLMFIAMSRNRKKQRQDTLPETQ